MNKLLTYFEGEKERVGFVLRDGTLVEVANHCSDPENGFEVSGEDIIRYTDDAVATWHTHPGETNNLSVGDYQTFLSWPNLRHFIIGTNGIREYYVEDGEVLIA